MEAPMLDGQQGPGLAAEMEIALMEQYLGRSLHSLHLEPAEKAERLWKEASLYASLHLEEMKARAHLIGELHSAPHEM